MSKLSKNFDNLLFKPALYVVSTPIGNLEDITFRALRLLKTSNAIFCEDTRRSIKLLNHYKITKPLYSCHKFNEEKVSEKIVKLVKEKNIVSLISDAGTPAISDPGQLVINHCLENNIDIIPIPGSSAVNSAISISGFENKFIFYGFLPKKKNDIIKELQLLKNINFCIIFFIPAKSINNYLAYFKNFFLNRKIFIAKEMTKKFEHYYRGDLQEFKLLPKNIKGELTVVISSQKIKKKHSTYITESVKVKILSLLKKYSIKDVAEIISKTENLSKKIVYKTCLEIKNL